MALVEIEDLRVEFGAEAAPVIAVDGIDLTLDVGEVVGGSMPQGSALLSTADQTKFRDWICTGAVQQ